MQWAPDHLQSPATLCRSNQRPLWSAIAVAMTTLAALMFYVSLYLNLPSSVIIARSQPINVFQPDSAYSLRFRLQESWSAVPVSPTASVQQQLLSIHWMDINEDFCPDLLLVAQVSSHATVSVFYLINLCISSPSTGMIQPVFGSPSHHALTLDVGHLQSLQDQQTCCLFSALVSDMNRDYLMDLTLLLNPILPSASTLTELYLSSPIDNYTDSFAIFTITSEKRINRVERPAISYQRMDNGSHYAQINRAATDTKPTMRLGPPLLAVDWDTNQCLELFLPDASANHIVYQSGSLCQL